MGGFAMDSISINKDKFIERLKQVKRQGIDDLIAYLEETDFFSAPASTRYHSSFDGGLVAHSLMTHKCLIRQSAIMDIPAETLTICGLLHDLCKANFYQKVTK